MQSTETQCDVSQRDVPRHEGKPAFKDGLHIISNDDYHASTGISRSALMHFKKSPAHYLYQYLSTDKEPSEPTDAMILGELVHTLALEPQKYAERFAIKPVCDRRTKAGKAVYADFESQLNNNQALISEDLYITASKMRDKLLTNDIFQAAIADNENVLIEKSIYFTHKATGLQCKVRPDAWDSTIVIDLKTTKDASYRDFQSSAAKYGYFLQAGMIYEGLKSIGCILKKFIFIAIEKDAPFEIGTYYLDEDAIEFGIAQFDVLMGQLADCIENDDFPGYDTQPLLVPSWLLSELND